MGSVRRIDDLGRVVIPKEIRRKLFIEEGDVLEVSYNNRIKAVTIRKYEDGIDYKELWEHVKNKELMLKETIEELEKRFTLK